MKIDADLRASIRSRVAISKKSNRPWEEIQEARRRAVENFLHQSKEEVRKRLCRQSVKHAKLKTEMNAISAEFEAIGVSVALDDYTDKEDFVKAGGILPEFAKNLGFDAIIAELSAAPESEREALLAKHNIIWK